MADSANGQPDQPEEVTGLALERALQRSVVAACGGWMFFSLVSGIYLTSFGKMLGLSKLQFGLLGALPSLVFPARLFGSLLVERLGHRKALFTATFAVSRALWLLVMLIPFFIGPGHSSWRAAVFLSLLLVSNTLMAMGVPVWLSWLGDLVPDDRRGRFFARRNAIASAAPVIPLLVFALVFDSLQEHGHEVWAYVVIFGFAVVVGELDLWIHYHIPEPKMKRVEGSLSFERLLSEPLRNPNFRRFLAYVGVTTFSMMFLGQFTNLYLLKVLDGVVVRIPYGLGVLRLRTYGIIAAIGVANVVLGLLLSRTWGYLIDRFGNKPLLRLLTLILVPLPLAWLFITREHPLLFTIPVFLIASVVYTAKNYMITNCLYAISPKANRTMFAALHGVVFSVFGALSPIVAGMLMHSLGDFETTLAGVRIEAFHVLCILTVGVRVIEQYVLGGFREPKSASARTLIRHLVTANPFVVLPRAYSLSLPVSAPQRATRVRRLGHSDSHLATPELLALLDDPSPEVRHQAALALGHGRDRLAVEPLVRRLGDGDAETRRQAAWALGKIGVAEAADSLVKLLSDPYPHVRSAAAIALGELSGERAAEALLAILVENHEPLEVASAATALGLLGQPAALPHILNRMQRADQPVLRRQLAVAAGDLLGPPHAFYSYLDAEVRVPGRRVARSVRRVRRRLRRAGSPELVAELDALADQIERAYHEGAWAECAGAMGQVCERLAQLLPGGEADLGVAGAYLRWLGGLAGSASDVPGFEHCVLGVFALEEAARRLRHDTPT